MSLINDYLKSGLSTGDRKFENTGICQNAFVHPKTQGFVKSGDIKIPGEAL